MLTIKVATANLAGAARKERAHPDKFKHLASVLGNVDLVGLQEVVRVIDPTNNRVIRDDLADLTAALAPQGYHCFFFPHLHSSQHSHPAKWASRVFKDDYQKSYGIYQGSAILVEKDHEIRDLLDDNRPGDGSGQIIPWYDETPTFYRGNRDTEPRSLLMARVGLKGGGSVLFCCTQLATISAEYNRKDPLDRLEGTPRRTRQVKWVAEYLRDYRRAYREYQHQLDKDACELAKKRNEEFVKRDRIPLDPIILVGDFNATPDASELAPLGNLGLTRLVPVSGPAYTHRDHEIEVDMCFSSIPWTRAEIVDLGKSEDRQKPKERISDHHPVIAEFSIP